ncbi:MAG: DsbA family protein [Gammaproteobacteria bacterium]|nr:MAG: DsbA family protein [Gammaproteobacteria bacterium]
MTPTLYYIHDPMCSWCWAFRPVWQEIQGKLDGVVRIHYLLGGLAQDDDRPMQPELRETIQGYWRRIQREVPGTRFNFDFWKTCIPRRSTWPACRAVIAARQQGRHFEQKMILAIQQAYYLQARNPSEPELLRELAGEIALDQNQFMQDMESDRVQHQLDKEIRLTRCLAVPGFPSLVLSLGRKKLRIPFRYTDADPAIQVIRAQIISSR